MTTPYPPLSAEECRCGQLTVDLLPLLLDIERTGHAWPWSEAVFRDCFKEGYEQWGIWHSDELAGFAILCWQFDEVHLLNLCVRRSRQRLGLGRRLLRFALAKAEEARARAVLLEVRSSNTPAIRLYQREGFASVGWRKDYYPAANGREDAQVMLLPFHEQ